MLAALMAFTACYGVLQLAMLGWGSRSARIRTLSPAIGAGSGEEDLGNIDSLTAEWGACLVDGDWGEVRIFSTSRPRLE